MNLLPNGHLQYNGHGKCFRVVTVTVTSLIHVASIHWHIKVWWIFWRAENSCTLLKRDQGKFGLVSVPFETKVWCMVAVLHLQARI